MIAGLYERIASLVFSYLDGVKGTSRIQKVHTPPSLSEDLTAYSVSGFEIRIYCKLEHNRRRYDRWFVPSENVISYRVYGIVSPDAPVSLKEVVEFDVCIPYEQKYFWMKKSRAEAIKEYLDVLITRLERLQQK